MRRIRQWVFTVGAVLLALAPLVAQDQTTEFLPVKPGDLAQDQIPAARLVMAAYAFVWVVFVAYLFVLWRRMARVDADLRDLSAKLGARRG